MKLIAVLLLTVALVGSIVAVNLWQRRHQAPMTAEEKKAEEAALAEERNCW